MSGPKRLAQMLARFTSEPPTIPRNNQARIARLLRLWAGATERNKLLLDEMATALSPGKSDDVPLRAELRAARFARLWEACTPARKRLIEWLAWELTPDSLSERPGPFSR